MTGSPAGRGTSATVASVITPSVPSEPQNRPTISSPDTPLTVSWPVRSTRPSASTTVRDRTELRVTPYLTQRSPPALMAMLPPIVEMSMLDGSGAYISPWGFAARSRSPLITPASTRATKSSGSMDRIRFIFASDRTRQPGVAVAPPDRPVPAPRVTTGTSWAWAHAIARATSSVERAETTARGAPAASTSVRSRE